MPVDGVAAPLKTQFGIDLARQPGIILLFVEHPINTIEKTAWIDQIHRIGITPALALKRLQDEGLLAHPLQEIMRIPVQKTTVRPLLPGVDVKEIRSASPEQEEDQITHAPQEQNKHQEGWLLQLRLILIIVPLEFRIYMMPQDIPYIDPVLFQLEKRIFLFELQEFLPVNQG